MMTKLATLSAKEADERRAAVEAKRARDEQHRKDEMLRIEHEHSTITAEAPVIAAELTRLAKDEYINSGGDSVRVEMDVPADPMNRAMVRHMRRELKKAFRKQGLRHFRLVVEVEVGDGMSTFAQLVIRKMETTS